MKIIEIIKEVINQIKDLHPNVKSKETLPILMTWDEYYNHVNPSLKSHGSDAYNYGFDKNAIFKCPSSSTCKIIKRDKINKIELEYNLVKTKSQYAKFDGDNYIGVFSDEEVEKLGKSLYNYEIVVTHNNVVVGGAYDEWGAVLINVVKEYRGLGIGENLVKMYRKIYPNKDSGGFTDGGYKQIRKYYNWMVKQALANGIYSDLVKRGEITKERVNEILSSVDKNYKFSKEKKNKLKDIYKGNNEPIYIIENNYVIIFDSILKNINEPSISNIDDHFIKDFIYAYAFIVDYNDNTHLYNAYGDKKYLEFAVEILATLNSDTGIGDYYFRNFKPEIKENLNTIWNNENKFNKTTIKDKGYIKGIDLNIIKPKRKINAIISNLDRVKKIWFKSFDKYGEIEDRIKEIAYGFSTDE